MLNLDYLERLPTERRAATEQEAAHRRLVALARTAQPAGPGESTARTEARRVVALLGALRRRLSAQPA